MIFNCIPSCWVNFSQAAQHVFWRFSEFLLTHSTLLLGESFSLLSFLFPSLFCTYFRFCICVFTNLCFLLMFFLIPRVFISPLSFESYIHVLVLVSLALITFCNTIICLSVFFLFKPFSFPFTLFPCFLHLFTLSLLMFLYSS